MTITIESQIGRHYATLAEATDGVTVAIWRRPYRGGGMAKRIDEWLLDCPLHLALDAVHDIVFHLPADAPAKQGRR